jgi:hypothetical protein
MPEVRQSQSTDQKIITHALTTSENLPQQKKIIQAAPAAVE